MLQLFAVTRAFGPAWNPSLPLEQQQDWRTHADFMSALEAEGFLLLGGPLVGTSEVLLIIRASEKKQSRPAWPPTAGLSKTCFVLPGSFPGTYG